MQAPCMQNGDMRLSARTKATGKSGARFISLSSLKSAPSSDPGCYGWCPGSQGPLHGKLHIGKLSMAKLKRGTLLGDSLQRRGSQNRRACPLMKQPADWRALLGPVWALCTQKNKARPNHRSEPTERSETHQTVVHWLWPIFLPCGIEKSDLWPASPSPWRDAPPRLSSKPNANQKPWFRHRSLEASHGYSSTCHLYQSAHVGVSRERSA